MKRAFACPPARGPSWFDRLAITADACRLASARVPRMDNGDFYGGVAAREGTKMEYPFSAAGPIGGRPMRERHGTGRGHLPSQPLRRPPARASPSTASATKLQAPYFAAPRPQNPRGAGAPKYGADRAENGRGMVPEPSTGLPSGPPSAGRPEALPPPSGRHRAIRDGPAAGPAATRATDPASAPPATPPSLPPPCPNCFLSSFPSGPLRGKDSSRPTARTNGQKERRHHIALGQTARRR